MPFFSSWFLHVFHDTKISQDELARTWRTRVFAATTAARFFTGSIRIMDRHNTQICPDLMIYHWLSISLVKYITIVYHYSISIYIIYIPMIWYHPNQIWYHPNHPTRHVRIHRPLVRSPGVDCKWSDWTDFTKCSKSCEGSLIFNDVQIKITLL